MKHDYYKELLFTVFETFDIIRNLFNVKHHNKPNVYKQFIYEKYHNEKDIHYFHIYVIFYINS